MYTRRLNVPAATVECAGATALHWLPARRHFDAVDLIACPEQLAHPDLPTVVVPDSAGFHRARLVREALPRLRRPGVYPYSLPPDSPGLSDIERLVRAIKRHDPPGRTYPTLDALQEAVHGASLRREAAYQRKPANQPRRAAKLVIQPRGRAERG